MKLEATIKANLREVSQLMELQKDVEINNKTWLLKKDKHLTTPEALKTAKRGFKALATNLRRYTTEAEAKKVNALFSKEPPKVYSQLQGNNSRTTNSRD